MGEDQVAGAVAAGAAAGECAIRPPDGLSATPLVATQKNPKGASCFLSDGRTDILRPLSGELQANYGFGVGFLRIVVEAERNALKNAPVGVIALGFSRGHILGGLRRHQE